MDKIYKAEIAMTEIKDYILARHKNVPMKTVTVIARDKLNALGKLLILYPKYKIYNLR